MKTQRTETVRSTFKRNHFPKWAIVAAAFVMLLSRAVPAAAQSTIYPPYAANDSAATLQGYPVTISLLDNDVGVSAPLDPSTVEILNYPSNGYVEVDEETGDVTYYPDDYFSGYDGFIYAVRDEYGNASNYAIVGIFVYPDNTPPVIENFTVLKLGGNEWILEGTVIGNNSPWFVVQIESSLPGLTSWVTIIPASDGTFSRTFSLDRGVSGLVEAVAINTHGIASNLADFYVSNE